MKVSEVKVVLGRSPRAFSAEELRSVLSAKGITVSAGQVADQLRALADEGAIGRSGEGFVYGVGDVEFERDYAEFAQRLGIESGGASSFVPSGRGAAASAVGGAGGATTAVSSPGTPDLADDEGVYREFAASLGVES